MPDSRARNADPTTASWSVVITTQDKAWTQLVADAFVIAVASVRGQQGSPGNKTSRCAKLCREQQMHRERVFTVPRACMHCGTRKLDGSHSL
ncbi:unnamed protein product [Ectocarpus sp. 13 AM-2016]